VLVLGTANYFLDIKFSWILGINRLGFLRSFVS